MAVGRQITDPIVWKRACSSQPSISIHWSPSQLDIQVTSAQSVLLRSSMASQVGVRLTFQQCERWTDADRNRCFDDTKRLFDGSTGSHKTLSNIFLWPSDPNSTLSLLFWLFLHEKKIRTAYRWLDQLWRSYWNTGVLLSCCDLFKRIRGHSQMTSAARGVPKFRCSKGSCVVLVIYIGPKCWQRGGGSKIRKNLADVISERP